MLHVNKYTHILHICIYYIDVCTASSRNRPFLSLSLSPSIFATGLLLTERSITTLQLFAIIRDNSTRHDGVRIKVFLFFPLVPHLQCRAMNLTIREGERLKNFSLHVRRSRHSILKKSMRIRCAGEDTCQQLNVLI